MDVNELARKAAEEIAFRFLGEPMTSVLEGIIAKHFAPLAEERDQWRRDCDRIQRVANAREKMTLDLISPYLEHEPDGTPCLGGMTVTLKLKRVFHRTIEMLVRRSMDCDRLLLLVKQRNVYAEHIGKPQDQPGWDTHDLCPCWDCRCNRLIAECEKEDKGGDVQNVPPTCG